MTRSAELNRATVDLVAGEYGLMVLPDDRAALDAAVSEVLAARACLRPLDPDDEPASEFVMPARRSPGPRGDGGDAQGCR